MQHSSIGNVDDDQLLTCRNQGNRWAKTLYLQEPALCSLLARKNLWFPKTCLMLHLKQGSQSQNLCLPKNLLYINILTTELCWDIFAKKFSNSFCRIFLLHNWLANQDLQKTSSVILSTNEQFLALNSNQITYCFYTGFLHIGNISRGEQSWLPNYLKNSKGKYHKSSFPLFTMRK